MSIRIFLFVRLTFFCILFLCLGGCRKENSDPVLVASFDGTLKSSIGEPDAQSRIEPDFKGYLTREALQLNPGDMVLYRAEGLNLQRGTLLLWLKPGFRLPSSRIRLLTIAGNGTPYVELTFGRNGIELLQQNATNEADVYRARGVHFVPGRWDLLAITWDNMSASLYLNGQPETCDRSRESNRVPSSTVPGTISIGLKLDQTGEDDFNEMVRDLGIWDQIKPADWIRNEYEQQNHPATLVYRERDLIHWAGKPIADSDAAGGEAWTGDTQLAELDGLKLPAPGDYDLTFQIKPLGNIRAGSLRLEVWTGDSGSKRILAARENENEELKVAGPNLLLAASKQKSTYQPFTVRFHTDAQAPVHYKLLCFLAGKYSFLLDTATVRAVGGHWQDVHRVEDLHHTMGVHVEDPLAAGGMAWSNQDVFNIGPYTCIGQPGRYRATWRVKIGNAAPLHGPLVLLKVFANDGFLPMRRGHKDYAGMELSASDIDRRNQWVKESVDFTYDGADMMEFYARTKVLEPGAICLDTVTVQQLSTKPQSEP